MWVLLQITRIYCTDPFDGFVTAAEITDHIFRLPKRITAIEYQLPIYWSSIDHNRSSPVNIPFTRSIGRFRCNGFANKEELVLNQGGSLNQAGSLIIIEIFRGQTVYLLNMRFPTPDLNYIATIWSCWCHCHSVITYRIPQQQQTTDRRWEMGESNICKNM